MARGIWTDDQLARLQEIWGTMRDAEVATDLGKTVSSVRLKATNLKLREKKGKRAGTRSGHVTSPWTKEEEMLLIKNVGHSSIFELIELLPGRTRAAIESRCRRLGFSPTQGTYTRCGIERETGYDWRQIKRARDALGQTWKRYGVRKYIITEEQYEEIIQYLKDEPRKWAKQWKLDACIKCGTSGRSERERHSGDGLCKSCLTGSSRIFVKNIGLCTIAEMYGKGAFEVWSGTAWRETEVVKNGERSIFELHISNGAIVELTEDHDIITNSGKVHAHSVGGVKIENITSDINLYKKDAAIPRRDRYDGRLGDRFPYQWNWETGVLLGMILGDGWISKSKYPTIGICAHRTDKEDLFPMRNLVASWCNTKSQVIDYIEKYDEYSLVKSGKITEMTRIQWRCTALTQFVVDLKLDKYVESHLRRAPESLWMANSDAIAGFISGMIATDGAIGVNNVDKIEISLSSVSDGLLRDVQLMLYGFGIRSSMWKYPKRPDRKQLYALSIFGIDNVRRFHSKIKIASQRKERELDLCLKSSNKIGRRPLPLTAKLVATDRVEPVYDLVNVGIERQYIANGVAVSNCWDRRRYQRNKIVNLIIAGKCLPLTPELYNKINRKEK